MDRTDESLAAIATVTELILFFDRKKLAPPVEPGSEAGFYMLAAYAFDTMRRILYMHKASLPFLRHAAEAESLSPEVRELALQFKRHNDLIFAAGDDWKAIAETVEAIMLDLRAELHEEHTALVDAIAGEQQP